MEDRWLNDDDEEDSEDSSDEEESWEWMEPLIKADKDKFEAETYFCTIS